MFALYARHEHQFLTEFFLVKLNHNGVPAGPKPEDLVGRIQTLFTELTSRDVAEEIYLVCRIFKVGEARDVMRPGTANTTSSSSRERGSLLFDMSRPGSPGGNRLQKTSSGIRQKGSRVSQMFNRATSPDGQNGYQPARTGGFTAAKVNGVHKGPMYRRPFGCAVLDLSHLLQDSSSLSENGTDHVMPIFVPIQEPEFQLLHERIIDSKTNKLYSLYPYG
jgi:dedicator of cytokinesis protein 3